MNKKAQTKIQKVGMGSLFGFSGIIIMSFGSVLNNLWMLRGGIVLTTFGMWLISWN